MGYRDYKQFAQGTIHHLYNRGVAKMNIFLDEQDYRAFMLRLRIGLGVEMSKMPFDKGSRIRLTQCPPNAFTIICYCLMPNHWHLVIQQQTELPLSALIHRVCTSYSKYFNKKYERVGPVFQDQFSAVMVEDDRQLVTVSAYVHQNPKVAGLVKNLSDWEHNSYHEYINTKLDPICERSIILTNFNDVKAYKDFVERQYGQILERKEIAALMLD